MLRLFKRFKLRQEGQRTKKLKGQSPIAKASERVVASRGDQGASPVRKLDRCPPLFSDFQNPFFHLSFVQRRSPVLRRFFLTWCSGGGVVLRFPYLLILRWRAAAVEVTRAAVARTVVLAGEGGTIILLPLPLFLWCAQWDRWPTVASPEEGSRRTVVVFGRFLFF